MRAFGATSRLRAFGATSRLRAFGAAESRLPLGALALAGLGGALMFFATATWDIWPLGWVCLTPFLLAGRALDRRAGGEARLRTLALVAWFGGTVANAGGFYWILGLLMRFGHLPGVGAFPLFLLLIGYQGLMYAFFGAMTGRLIARGVPAALAAPIVLVPLELVYPMIFPWYLAINQAWVPNAIQVAELTGPTGVSALLALSGGAAYDVLAARFDGRPFPRWSVASAVAIISACVGLGMLRMRTIEARRAAAPQVKIGLVQANIPQLEKFDARFAEQQFEVHHAASVALAKQGAELIVWPESSYPGMIDRAQKHDWPSGSPLRIRQGWEVPTLIGSPTGTDNGDAWNSAIMINRMDRFVGRFDKNYLMVFGEYIPFYTWLPQFKEWFPEASNWERGQGVAVFPFDRRSPVTGQREDFRLAPIICYEDIIPSFVRKYAPLRPHLFINITNDAWFGKTAEPYEHLQLAVFRSIEQRRDMVRAVNTGVSTFVAATGRVYRQSAVVDPLVERMPPITLLDKAAMLEGDTVYNQVGDLFAYLCSASLLVLLWRARRRRG